MVELEKVCLYCGRIYRKRKYRSYKEWENRKYCSLICARFSHGGKIVTEKTRKKSSESHKGQHNSPETEFKKGHKSWNDGLKDCFDNKTLERISNKMKGKISPMKDKKHKESSKQIQREKRIKDIESKFGQCVPNYNKTACVLFERLNERFGLKLKHAENGGESCVIGYFLDAYDEKKNLVIEYDESYHEKGKQHKKDKLREENIIRELGCKFIRINEKDTYERICEKIFKSMEK